MRSYQRALEQYEHAYNPPRSKKWKAMNDNARALNGTRATWYAIHKKEDGTIYYRLYDTNVATFYPPNEQGEYMVELNYYNSVTTNRFMWAHSLHYSAFLTTEGKQVRVPYVSQYHAKKQGRPCSARLVFDAEDKLIVSKSWHADIYTKVSTPKDRAERLAYRKQLDVILTLAQFRLPEYKENVDIDAELGQPFNTAWATVRGEHEFLMYKNDPVESVYFINGVLAVAQGVVDVLASTRAYKANAIGHYYKFNLTQEEISAKEAERRTKQQTILDTITPEDFRKSLENRIMRANNMHIGSADKSWGQFRERLPYVYHVEATNLLK